MSGSTAGMVLPGTGGQRRFSGRLPMYTLLPPHGPTADPQVASRQANERQGEQLVRAAETIGR